MFIVYCAVIMAYLLQQSSLLSSCDECRLSSRGVVVNFDLGKRSPKLRSSNGVACAPTHGM